MTPDEERIAFYSEIGLTLVIWAVVEKAVLDVASLCVAKSEVKMLGRGYYSIENFRSKLKFADALVTERLPASHLNTWAKLVDDVHGASQQRNRIAHCQVILYQEGSPGRRWAVVSALERLDNLVVRRKRAPSHALCLRGIMAMRYGFHDLTSKLYHLYAAASGMPTPLAASVGPMGNPPTIAQIRNQNRARFGPPPKPSRQKS